MKDKDESCLKILTLNCWGVKYISKNYNERTKAIQDEMSKGQHDVVALQEVWENAWYEEMKKHVKTAYPFSHYFHSGVIGSGLCIFSRYPIIETQSQSYPLNGYFYAIAHGDWFAGKGATACLIDHPKRNFYVVNTHLHADYASNNYREIRTLQSYVLARFVQNLSAHNDAVIMCGDMNHEEHEIGMQTLCKLGNLKSCWIEAKKKLTENCHSIGNPDSQFSSADNEKCIDFILINPSSFETEECGLDFHLIPNTKKSFSDHIGVAATVRILDKNDEVVEESEKKASHADLYEELHSIMANGMKQAEDIQWQRISVAWLILLIFLFMPVFSADSFHVIFPNLYSLSGKMIFILQIISIFICLIYFWIVIINRQIEVNGYKNCLNEIDVKWKSIKNKLN